jgi:hypothetical protein
MAPSPALTAHGPTHAGLAAAQTRRETHPGAAHGTPAASSGAPASRPPEHCAWVIRESRDRDEGRRFDPPGIALLTAALSTLLWGLIDAEKHAWGHFTPFAWLISAALLLVLFVVWEIR